MVLPGGGVEPVEVVFVMDAKAKSPDTEAEEEIPVEAITEAITEVIKKEQNMNDMLLMFWHGVIAVLIGEASALLVTFAWRKDRK